MRSYAVDAGFVVGYLCSSWLTFMFWVQRLVSTGPLYCSVGTFVCAVVGGAIYLLCGAKACELQLAIDDAYKSMFSGRTVIFHEEENREPFVLEDVDEALFATLGKDDPTVWIFPSTISFPELMNCGIFIGNDHVQLDALPVELYVLKDLR